MLIPLTYGPIIVLSLVTLIVVTIQRNKSRQRISTTAKSKVKTCDAWPRVRGRLPGNIDVLYKIASSFGKGTPGAIFAQLATTYGQSFDLCPLGSSMIYTQDPLVIRHILSDNPQNYVKGLFLNHLFRDVLGTGIFNSDGEQWKTHRNAARPYFNKENIRDISVFQKHGDNLVLAVQSLAELEGPRSKALEFHDLAARFTLDVATELLLGSSVNTLRSAAAPKEDPEYLKAFDRVQARLAKRLRAGLFWKLTDDQAGMQRDMKTVESLLDKAMNAQSDELPTLAEAGAYRTLLHFLENQSPSLSHRAKRDEILNVLMAARDTTASLITSTIYELARNPTVQDRARTEILTEVGPNGPRDSDDIRVLKYVKAILNETLRQFIPSYLSE